jgi:hypothetical protein
MYIFADNAYAVIGFDQFYNIKVHHRDYSTDFLVPKFVSQKKTIISSSAQKQTN